MMIKGWMKHLTNKNEEQWVFTHAHPFGETYVGIQKWGDGRWRVFKRPAFSEVYDYTLVYRDSKKEAKDYAIEHMRRHPNG